MNFEEFTGRYLYSIEDDYLGGGGFGKVYKAYDDALDKWVAIKVSEVHRGQENLSLKKEVELANKIPDHRNIANYDACYRFFQAHGTFDYGLLQYYEVGNLSQLINSKKLSTKQRVDVAHGIIKGLEHLHNHDIIHQDMKSANILIAHRKKSGAFIPKITDFGLSKEFNSNDRSFINNSIVAFTLVYSSPEQMGGKEVRKNADIWSLGVILFELFTGKVPFSSIHHNPNSTEGRAEIINQIQSATLPASIETIPDPFKSLIKRCIVADPSQRLKSTDQVWAILKQEKVAYEALEDLPVVGSVEETEAPIVVRKEEEDRKLKSSKKLPVLENIDETVHAPNIVVQTKIDKSRPAKRSKQLIAALVSLVLLFGGYKAWTGSDNGEDSRTGEFVITDSDLKEDTSMLTTILSPPQEEEIDVGDEPKSVDTERRDKTARGEEITRETPNPGPEPVVVVSPPVAVPVSKSADELAWEKANANNTKESYKSYIDQYSSGKYIAEAKQRYMGKVKGGSGKAAELPTILKLMQSKMKRVSGGSFQMGCDTGQDTNCSTDEQPVHQVSISSFSLSKHEVTQAEWEAVMNANPSTTKCPDCPVNNISYEEAEQFITQLNAKTKKRYRLPTEAEWEYAARGGSSSKGNIHAGDSSAGAVAWTKDNAGGKVHPVGKKRPNELGLYDMNGNVWEWTNGCFSNTYDRAPANGKANKSGDCNAAAMRGGSFKFATSNSRNTNRRRRNLSEKDKDIGFRLAL